MCSITMTGLNQLRSRGWILLLAVLFAMPCSHSSVAADLGQPVTVPDKAGLLTPPVDMESADGIALYEGCGGAIAQSSNVDYEQQVIELVNQVRDSYGLPPLKRNQELTDAARYHAVDLAVDNYFAHDSYDLIGQSLAFACPWYTRVSSYYPGYASISENIAAGYPNPQQVMDGWLGSSGHRANILSTSHRELGVGYYYYPGGLYGAYWVQDFGRRSSVYPLIINGEQAVTSSRNVNLYIHGSWTEIRLRNDSNTWSAWQPFSSNLAWTLAGINGTRTVSAEMRTSSGASATASDTILLQGSFVVNDTIGVFSPYDGSIGLRSENTSGYADRTIFFGLPGDQPVMGDWNGDGVDTLGVYRNGMFYLRNSNSGGTAELAFAFGAPGDLPVAGDWDGNGTDTVGVYRNGVFFLRNSNSTGAPDMVFALGQPGDLPLAGDWTGQGRDTVGVFRPANGSLYLKNSNQTGYADICCAYGIPNDQPVVGDWDGNGTDTIGVYRNGVFLLRNSNTTGYAQISATFGSIDDEPISGKWGSLQ